MSEQPSTIYRRGAVDAITTAIVQCSRIGRASIRHRVDQALRATQNGPQSLLPKTDPLPAGDVLLFALTRWPQYAEGIRKQFPGISPSPKYVTAQVEIAFNLPLTVSGITEPKDEVELRKRFRDQQLDNDTLRVENAHLRAKAVRLDQRIENNRVNGRRSKSPARKS